MADIPPVSDPQVIALLEQAKARRKRAIIIFVAVALVLVVGLGGSAAYASAQAKKKRNVAYSRVIKCLFGKPLDSGEAPMTRIRSAWRARILSEKRAEGDVEQQEAKDTAEWPNRCVAEMIAFTDTLKDIGEMKEGDKDLGFYSRDLSKQTAGSNWKNVDTYQAAVEAFMTEAQKGNFDYVDIADVKAPELMDAEPIDAAFPKSTALEDTHIDPYGRVTVVGTSARFYVPAAKGKPARLCATADGKELVCTPMTLPPEASGVPWVLPSDDAAQPLLAFGRFGGIADGSSVSIGVFRASDGAEILPADAFYVAGGFTKADGSAALLLKDSHEPQGDHFKVGRVAANATKPALEPITLTDWDERPSSVAMIGSWVVWVTTSDQLKARSIDQKDPVLVATLPGSLRAATRGSPFSACRTKNGMFLGVSTRADGLGRMLVTSVTDAAFGKPQTTDDGDLSCTDDAAVVVSSEAISTCTEAGCNATKIELHVAPEIMTAVGPVLVRASKPSGLLRIEWLKDGKPFATKLYDAQMKGTILLGESKLGHLEIVGHRDYGLVLVDVGGTQHVARIDATGAIKPVTVKL
jgi:hypothetical protein